ncbi:MAG: hypothetical protein SF051_15770 [Elusimicrobiota bacterium]|nr:hypothetical protein [Elusimicrobiota bacterium]
MNETRFGQLTKEMVAEELRRLGDPCAAAALVVGKTLAAALDGPASLGQTSPEQVIEDAVKGAMTALLLADQSLTRGAILALEAVAEAAGERHIDPTTAMLAALRGIADLRRFVEPDRMDGIRLEIEAHYHGAGEAFAQYLREPLQVR